MVTQILLNSQNFYQYNEDFLIRQNNFLENNQKKKAEMKEQNLKDTCPFRPELNQVSRQLIEDDGPKNLADHIRKVAVVDRERHETLMEHLRQEELGKHSFKPSLNRKSQDIASRSRDPTKLTNWTEKETKRVTKMKVELC